MTTASNFLSSVSKLQMAASKASKFPGWKWHGLWALAEILKSGFIVEEAVKEEQDAIPQNIRTWARDVERWATGTVTEEGFVQQGVVQRAFRKYQNSPDRQVQEQEWIDQLRSYISKGKQLPQNEKVLLLLDKAFAKLAV